MCSTGFCLVFFLAQVVFQMNYSEQQTTVVMENGAISESEINVDIVMKQYILKFYTVSYSTDLIANIFYHPIYSDRNDS